MHTLFLVVLYGALSCASSDSNQYKTVVLMDNVLVVRVPYDQNTRVNVPLTCGEAHQNKSVFWRKNGSDLKPALQGNQVSVMVEEFDGGNYTCHLSPDGEYLNHTVIMVRLNPDNRPVMLERGSPEEGHIHCSAHNYTGSFQCNWTKSSSRPNAAVFLVKAERNFDMIPCELNADGSGVHCQYAHCSYKEEQQLISLTVYMHSFSRLEAYRKAFYLRDIVRPESLPNLHIRNGNEFRWSYPDSWERPCSFFGLRFQVKVVGNKETCNSEKQIMNITTEETHFKVNLKTKKYVFCVRAQDKYTNGPFSPWNHYTVNRLK